MKKSVLVSLLLLASTSIYSASSGKNNFYVRLDGGISMQSTKVGSNNIPLLQNTKFKETGVYGLGFGYKFNDYFRTDINAQYRDLNYNSSNASDSVINKTKNATAFWNLYLDCKNSTIFTPYFTGGVGYSRLMVGNATNTTISSPSAFPGKSANNVAWNIGIGSKIQITSNLDFDLAYRYVELGKVGFANAGQPNPSTAGRSVTLKNHEAILGISYNF